MCILVTIQGDDTQLGPSSFKEEDVVELCIGVGQEYAVGVLWLPDTEAVLASKCDTNMMAMMCCLTAAKICWDEPIMLCILPHKGRQVREYVTMRSSSPSVTQTNVQGWRVGIWPLSNLPSQDKGPSEAQASMPQAELTRDVKDLGEDQLQEVLEVLQTEMAQRDGAASPLGLPWGIQGSLGVVVKLWQMTGKWIPEERGYGCMESPCHDLEVPLNSLQMIADSSACPQPGWGWAHPISIPSVVMPFPERLRYLFCSGIMRLGVSRTTTKRWWSGKVSSVC